MVWRLQSVVVCCLVCFERRHADAFASVARVPSSTRRTLVVGAASAGPKEDVADLVSAAMYGTPADVAGRARVLVRVPA